MLMKYLVMDDGSYLPATTPFMHLPPGAASSAIAIQKLIFCLMVGDTLGPFLTHPLMSLARGANSVFDTHFCAILRTFALSWAG